jgi:hypothetical protein
MKEISVSTLDRIGRQGNVNALQFKQESNLDWAISGQSGCKAI